MTDGVLTLRLELLHRGLQTVGNQDANRGAFRRDSVKRQEQKSDCGGDDCCGEGAGHHGRYYIESQPAARYFPTMCSMPREFSQAISNNSVSGSRRTFKFAVQGLVYAFGSSIVMAISMCPKSVRRKRSMTCSASVWGCPTPVSIQPRSLKPMVSTFSTLPSHIPTE